MKKTVLTFGLMSGAVISVLMLLTMRFHDAIGFETAGLIVGYTTMVLAFLLIYFGVRSYRDNVAGGTVRFGRAFVGGSADRPRVVDVLRGHLGSDVLQVHAGLHGQVQREGDREGARVGRERGGDRQAKEEMAKFNESTRTRRSMRQSRWPSRCRWHCSWRSSRRGCSHAGRGQLARLGA